jgi:UDP-glucuronate 4-epimerase
MGDKAVVTGCAGFIGSHLCEALLSRGREVVGIDNLDAYYAEACGRGPWERQKSDNLALLTGRDGFSFVAWDVRGAGAPKYAEASTVFHLAAKPGVRFSVGRGESYASANVLGTQAVLDRATQAGVGRFVVASSSSVYGNAPAPFREDGPARPMSPYGASKLAAEAMCDAHALSNPGLSVASLRLFCVYGPRCRPDLALSKFARLMLAGDPVPVYGDMDALSRDYTFIDDVVGGFLAAEAAARPGHLVCNIGSGSPVSLRDAIRTIAGALGVRPAIDQRPGDPADAAATHADTSRAERELGWRADTGYADGVARCAAWLGSRPRHCPKTV